MLEGGAVTYSEVLERSNGLCWFLSELGLRHGSRVAVILPNIPETIYTWFALARLGAVMAPINPALTRPEVEPLLRSLGVTGLIGDAKSVASYGECLDLRACVVVGEGEVAGAVRFVAPPCPTPPVLPWRGCPEDLLTILQSSGTTGQPKLAGLTHLSYVRPAWEFVRWMEVVPEDRFLGCLPLFHMAGQAFVASAVAAGASLALVGRFSAHRFWEQVRTYGITVVRHLGEMLAVLCRQPAQPDDLHHPLRAVYGGGARPDVIEEFERRFGVPVVEGYGLTETNTVLRNELRQRRLGSIGRPLPYAEVRIADEQGKALPPRQVGEIQVRHDPRMMPGYVGPAEVKASCSIDGWFRTGDLGYQDEQGHFYFAGRQKDLIRRRGENIYPGSIEQVLDRHPAVAASAVVGVPDELGGEEVKAYLVCRPGASLGLEDLVAWCRSWLAEFKIPRYFEICAELPWTATHKINRGRLRLAGTAGGLCYERPAAVKGRPDGSSQEWSSLIDLLRVRAKEQGEKTAFTFLEDGEDEESALTYAELDARARSLGAWLQKAGLAGERVLLLHPPGLEFIAAFFGCLYGGAVAVPVHPPGSRRSLPRLLSIVDDARPAAALTTAASLPRLAALAAQVEGLGAVRLAAPDGLSSAGGEGWSPPGATRETPAFLQYTSGSTAAPKGVVVSHGNLLHNEEMIRRAFAQSRESVVVGWLPLYHDMGLIGNILQPLYAGARCVLMAPMDFLTRPVRWLRAITRYRATTSGGPNFAYELCLRKIGEEERRDLDLSSWQVAFSGAEPVRAATLDGFARAFAPCGFRREAFYPCYGLAEATLFVSGGTAGEGVSAGTFSAEGLAAGRITAGTGRTLVGCGRAWLGQEIAIVDPQSGQRCPPDRVGEIWVAGPSVARGYWGRPEETERDFRARLSGEPEAGPFLRTGDLGFLAGGELLVAGRLKDLIILRGRNHYPQDIEQTAEPVHPALRPGCGAAFSVEVDREECLVVVWELDPHRVEEAAAAGPAIRQAVAEEHEVQVHDVVLVRAGTVPKTSSGKIRRQACRAGYLSGGLEVLWRSGAGGEAAAGSGDGGPELSWAALSALAPEERLPALAAGLRREAAAALRVAPSRIPLDEPLTRLGLDSLAAVELKGSVEAKLRVPVPLGGLLEGVDLSSLARRLAAELAAGDLLAEEGPVAGASPEEEHGLSYGQRAMWFLARLAPASRAYVIAAAARVRPAPDLAALGRALAALARRHPALRTTFREAGGGVVQRAHPGGMPELSEIDAAGWDEAALTEGLEREAGRAFDLTAGPLLRLVLFRRTPGESVLLLAVHHIVADLRSLGVLARELGLLYAREAGAAGEEPLPALPITYADWVRWQETLFAGPRGNHLRRFWRERLTPLPAALDLPTDRPRPRAQGFRGGAVNLRLGAELSAVIAALASGSGTTLFATLLGGFAALLYRYTGQEDLAIGSPTAGRGRPEVAGLVGYLVNPVVLRLDPTGELPFCDLLARTRRRVQEALEHQDFPFPLLAERLQPERDLSRTPLVQAVFTLQQAESSGEAALAAFAVGEAGAVLDLGGLTLETIALPERSAPFDLVLRMAEVARSLVVSFQYDADLFDASTALRMAEHLRELLRGAASDPLLSLAALPLLTGPERAQALHGWNDTVGDLLVRRPVHELVEERAERFPEAPAVLSGDAALSYRDLDLRANRLARRLRCLGVGPESAVALCLERSLDLVVSALAVLKAGGAYAPLDPSHPVERLAFMAADLGSRVVLAGGDLAASLAAKDLPVLRLDQERESLAAESSERLPTTADFDHLAYVIYTSGSTGRPKGVEVSHGALANLVSWHLRSFGVGTADRTAQVCGVAFDAAVWDLWPPLVSGGALDLVEEARRSSSASLRDWLIERGITVAFVPTPLAEAMLPLPWPARAPLRLLLTGGDALHLAPREDLPFALINNYGPTENAVVATSGRVPPDPQAVRLPGIGRAIDNVEVHLVDRCGEPVPVGVAGELLIGGDSLARGYHGRSASTAGAFVPHPWSTRPGARLYRTGDLARRRPGGEIEFVGRTDTQVKIRGFRIELGEIEASLRRHPGLREAAVVLQGGEEDSRLVAYVVPRGEPTPGTEELRSFLSGRLPAYMVPAAFVPLGALPLTRNGKLDRRALPDSADASPGTSYVAPRSAFEAALAGIWAEVLGAERIGVHDNFFALGGHSLNASRVLSKIHAGLGVELPMRSLFEAPTIAELSVAIVKESARRAGQETVFSLLSEVEKR